MTLRLNKLVALGVIVWFCCGSLQKISLFWLVSGNRGAWILFEGSPPIFVLIDPDDNIIYLDQDISIIKKIVLGAGQLDLPEKVLKKMIKFLTI